MPHVFGRSGESPKLQTACTLVAVNGMVVRTDTEQVHQARKAMLEFLLTNHPLDCPVCDKGGECELQDMTLSLWRRTQPIRRRKTAHSGSEMVESGVLRRAALYLVLPLCSGL